MWGRVCLKSQAAKPNSKLVAVLGPTNTGKTHRAIERMLEHRTGMLGLPLRLLAREVYDRLTREVGEQAVALVTGEEKRLGREPRYWVCTVEAMPVQHEVDFLAVDEIQLAAHPHRGHVFTERLLHARGRSETWFLGADTMRPLLREILPTSSVESHTRLSTLSARGQARLGTLPARSAVVAFSIPEVYRLAERLRHRRGGAAVVLGALSPRARNAQVALYEAREVDYLVATDAIGMGLNLGIRHVAFAGLRKFDGKDDRQLAPAEIAQIAGRAGRYKEDGTFGTLAPVAALPEGLSRSIEEHRFEPVRRLTWRNSDLCTSSVPELLESLRQPPARSYLNPLVQSTDLEALRRLETDAEVRSSSHGMEAVELLWQICQIPDYRQWLPELHAQLVKAIFLQLRGPGGRIAEDWLAREIAALDNLSGDVDALTARIASIRTWTYVSNHRSWLNDDAHWIERTRDIEDRLSDALHERLVERFVTRRRSFAEIPASAARIAAQPAKGEEGNPFLVLEGLRERLLDRPEAPSLERWIDALVTAPHEEFHLDETGQVFAGKQCVGLLVRGKSLLRPEVKLMLDGLDAGQRLRLSRRLLAWSRDMVQEVVGSLSGGALHAWSPSARGLLYQLEQSLGSVSRSAAKAQLGHLTTSDRRRLSELGVHVGRLAVWSSDSLRPRQRITRLALSQACEPLDPELLAPLSSRVSFAVHRGLPEAWLNRAGFLVLGQRAVRADLLERVSHELNERAQDGPFELPPMLAQWLGCSEGDAVDLTIAIGYRRGTDGSWRMPRKHRRGRRPKTAERSETQRPPTRLK